MRRRTLLAAGVTAAGTTAGLVWQGRLAATAAASGAAAGAGAVVADRYGSNTELYQDPTVVEGVDYARRYRRHEVFDDDLTQRAAFGRSTVVAPHGGGIEVGTSELCLAIAGYHPATLEVTPPGGATHDYWMFEGLRASDNGELHVTSTRCDDGVVVAMCAGSLNVLSLHGCTTSTAGLPDGTAAVLVGGRDLDFRQRLLAEFAAAGVSAMDAADRHDINGDHPDNIANRTLRGMGGHLEITTPLRQAMFGVNTRSQRKHTTTPVFWDFAEACRRALAAIEATQPIR